MVFEKNSSQQQGARKVLKKKGDKHVLKKKGDKHKVKGNGKSGPNGEFTRKSSKSSARRSARADEDVEIKNLEARIRNEAPKAGWGAFTPSAEKGKGTESAGGPALTTRLFQDLAISQRTLKGLAESEFVNMTEIQRGAIPHALVGRDVLGEARTGSGKTLAFLVPLIELLYRSRWTRMDGLGAVVISPTRELSYQIYQVLVDVGAQHDFSAGCVVGGKDMSEEQGLVTTRNILVASPGRFLHHLDETPGFDASNLQMLILDEADRILDFGFQETIHNILAHLPQERQSMLFSATLHNSIHRLGKAALKSPEIVSVHKNSKSRAPDKLKQVYMTVPLDQKIDVLFSFLRTHSQKKIIVFVSSCKQVRFFFECFRQLKPGPAIMELHGRQSLTKRMVVFNKFSERERAMALFCTDIAARGVDFPEVDWVVQLDCPDTVDTYVHRVGRTARYESAGSSALFLLPSEEAFIAKLKAQRMEVKNLSAKQGKIKTIQSQIQGVVAGDQAIKHLAQKALISYVRSIHLNKDKEVFQIKGLPLENFANSIGLHRVPEELEKLIDGSDAEKNPLKAKKNKSALQRLKDKIKAKKSQVTQPDTKDATDDDSESDDRKKNPNKRKLSRLERRDRRIKHMDSLPEKPKDEEEDDLLIPVDAPLEELPVTSSVRKRKLKLGRDGVAKGAEGTHTFFGNKSSAASGEFAHIAHSIGQENLSKNGDSKESRQAFLQRVSADLAQRDGSDAAVSRARIHDQHLKRRKKAKDQRQGDDGEESDTGVQLGGASSAASRSPSPCPSSEDNEPASYQGTRNAFGQGKVSAGRQAKSAFGKVQQQPVGGEQREGEKVGAGDDLGALEAQVLSKLSGLF